MAAAGSAYLRPIPHPTKAVGKAEAKAEAGTPRAMAGVRLAALAILALILPSLLLTAGTATQRPSLLQDLKLLRLLPRRYPGLPDQLVPLGRQ